MDKHTGEGASIDSDYPVVILSHRRQAFLGRTMWSLNNMMTGSGRVTIVDDSGDHEHHQWLDDHGFQFSAVHPTKNMGYLEAMNRVWQVAACAADEAGVEYAVLWEEDFVLRKPVDLSDMATVMENRPRLAQLNFQRQAVYRVERRFGYMESHQQRGYRLSPRQTEGIKWVRRATPFTTNPGMIRREVLDLKWPARHEADSVLGGAEPAMSRRLEPTYEFGWLGGWNSPHVRHVGDDMKSGKGY